MKMIDAHETEAVVDIAASVRVQDLPFATGDRVRVLVLREVDGASGHTPDEITRSRLIREGLRGSVLRYDNPNEPVAGDDWETLKPNGGLA